MSPSDRLEACVAGQVYTIPKRADLQAVLDERRELLRRSALLQRTWDDLADARAAAQASAELASDYARQLLARPSWPEFWAVLLLLPFSYAIGALGTPWSVVPYSRG